MGTTYCFSKLNRKDFLSGKILHRWLTPNENDPDSCWDILNDNSIGGECDRDYFLGFILDTKNTKNYIDGELSKYCDESGIIDEMQLTPITLEMVQRAIKILEDLDAKVFSMPYEKELATEFCCAGMCDASYNDLSKHKYVEPVAPLAERQVGNSSNYVFYGPSKQYVDIVREVYKVYDWKEYHYRYPWRCEDLATFGSYDVKSALKEVEAEMLKDNNGSVFVMYWY